MASEILSSLVIIIIIAVIVVVFISCSIAVSQFRRVRLSNNIRNHIMDKGCNHLEFESKDMKHMYPIISSIWEERACTHPVPDKNRLAKGWCLGKDNEVVCIRKEIIQSRISLETLVTSTYHDMNRKSSETLHQYLNRVIKRSENKLISEDIDNYLFFYHEAKYGSSKFEFDSLDYQNFMALFNRITASFS